MHPRPKTLEGSQMGRLERIQAVGLARISHPDSGRAGLYTLRKNCPRRTTTPAPEAPPLLNQEGSCRKRSPPQMRRGGAPNAGVVLTVLAPSTTGFFRSL